MDINQIIQNIETNKTPPPSTPKPNFVPLISISGITILSFGGLMLLKSNNTASLSPIPEAPIDQQQLAPTQVPKSIQHYLLASQQNFTQALNITDETQKIELINQSILAASDAIKEFPQDHRGFYQRARIYQSLSTNKIEFLDQAITDYNQANQLNPNSAEITRDLASAYAQKGDSTNTLNYLTQTINLEPTKAQNFYDLAKIQEQSGYINDAITTYNQLLTLVSDNNQKQQIQNEKATLEKIIQENPSLANQQYNSNLPTISQTETPSLDSPKIQATDFTASSLIVASPEETKTIEVKNQTNSNSLSGTNLLLSGQKEIFITNSQINNQSQIYVTAIQGGKNQNLQVLSKSDTGFTVGLDSPINEDIQFKWWIIN
jgi:tetratricopeptide (TPR) repeat protein